MSKRIIITGGGTGGHIFPAISIADRLKELDSDCEILFVGAEGGMEMELVPKHGYRILPVSITGIARQITLKNIFRNLIFPFKLMISLMQSRKIIREFRPDVVVGVGGYASGPVGRIAGKKKIPLVICEQNAYPGITNKWLAPKADLVLLGNEAASKYFDAHDGLKVTGNPVRASLKEGNRDTAIRNFRLNPNKPIILALGGSLGAKNINDAIEKNIQEFVKRDIQLIWQCGKRYYEELKPRVPDHPHIRLMPFIDDMPSFYAAANLVISRAGASTISEIILLSKPSILVPSPNVAEDHQTKNAMSLADNGAAIIIKDSEARVELVKKIVELVENWDDLIALKKKIEKEKKHNAADEIAREILGLIKIDETLQSA